MGTKLKGFCKSIFKLFSLLWTDFSAFFYGPVQEYQYIVTAKLIKYYGSLPDVMKISNSVSEPAVPTRASGKL